MFITRSTLVPRVSKIYFLHYTILKKVKLKTGKSDKVKGFKNSFCVFIGLVLTKDWISYELIDYAFEHLAWKHIPQDRIDI